MIRGQGHLIDCSSSCNPTTSNGITAAAAAAEFDEGRKANELMIVKVGEATSVDN